MLERRRFVRLSESWPIKYKILGTEKDRENSLTVNIGEGGVKFYTNAILETGSILEIELLIPADSIPLQSTAKVVWKGKVIWCEESPHKDKWPLVVGVEFVNISDYDKKRLMIYVKNKLEKERMGY